MTPLTTTDYAALEKSYLTRVVIDAARIQRVPTVEGADIVGRKATASNDYAGLVFPYLWPGDTHPREYRLRRDNPDLERKNGAVKERNKYLSPPGKGNLLYIPPDTPPEWLTDVSIPVTITEGEKKALALWRFYQERGEKRLVIGLPGVWNWRGVVGKATNGNGKRQDVKGVISDFDRIEWRGRDVLIVFDVNALTDETVAAARRELARELQRRGAAPSQVNLPIGLEGVNGVDDLLAKCGPGFLAGLLSSAETAEAPWEPVSEFTEYVLPPFPLDALPPVLRTFASELAVETQTPVDMAAMLALANASASIAGKVEVRVRGNWRETTNIYTVNALGVGERKTAAHDMAKEPLEEVEKQLIRDSESTITEKETERKILAKRVTTLEDAAAKEDDATERQRLIKAAQEAAKERDACVVPIKPKLIAMGNTTPEAIGKILVAQGGRLFLSSDEGELFQMLAGRYGNGENFEILLNAHTGATIRIERVGRSEIAERATLTIALTVQPAVLREFSKNPSFRDKGLTARFLYSMPISLVGGRDLNPEQMSDGTRQAYAERIKKLAALTHDEDEHKKPIPKIVELTCDALGCLDAFRAEIEPQLGEGGALRPIGDWANKLAGVVVRIAAILHYAEAPAPHTILQIPALAIERAIKIARYLIPHAQAAYAEMGIDPEIEAARKLLAWILAAKSRADSRFSRREAQTANPTKFPKVTDLDAPLKLLEAHGYIRAVETKRRDSRFYEINPTVWEPAKPRTKPFQQFSAFSASSEANEDALTDHPATAESAELLKDSDFPFSNPANGAQSPASPASKEVFRL
jgi:hypothetical protein